MTKAAVSVLLPSRRRPVLLGGSVTSLATTAAHPERVEVLVAADPDDPGTQGFALPAPLAGYVLTAPRRWGRGWVHEYYNWLAAQATGDWLLIFNDDAVMETPGWDSIISEQEPGVVVVGSNHSDHVFLAIPASWVRAAGQMSPTPDLDNFLFEVGSSLGCVRRPPVRIFHDPYYLTGANNDENYQEGLAGRRRFDEAAGPDWGTSSGREQSMRRMIGKIRGLPG